VSLIRKEEFFKKLISEIFSSHNTTSSFTSAAHVEHGIFLLAYMSCKGEDTATLVSDKR
jgi:hypothetical protein